MKRLTALLLMVCLVLSVGAASAAVGTKPLVDAFQQLLGERFEDKGLTATLTGKLDSLANVSDKTLKTLQDWAQKTTVRLAISPTPGRQQAKLSLGDKDLLSFDSADGFDKAIVTMPSGSWAVDAPAARQDALELWPLRQVPERIAAFLPKLGSPETVKKVLNYEGIGRAVTQQVYTLTADEAMALHAEISAQVLQLLSGAGSLLEQARQNMEALSFVSPLQVKQLFDKEEKSLGFQVQGDIAILQGKPRKMTLTAVSRGEALLVSLRAPAKAGKNDMALTYKLTSETVKGSTKVTLLLRVFAAQATASAEDRLDAVLTLGAARSGARSLTGMVTATTKKTGDSPLLAITRLRPRLSVKDEAIEGTVTLETRKNKRPVLNATLNLSAGPLTETLSALPQAAEASQDALQKALAEALAPQILSLPDEERALFIHDLGRDLWTEGDPVAPAGDIVNKEENP